MFRILRKYNLFLLIPAAMVNDVHTPTSTLHPTGCHVIASSPLDASPVCECSDMLSVSTKQVFVVLLAAGRLRHA